MLQQLAFYSILISIIVYILNKIAKTSKFQLIGDYVTHVKTQEKAIALTYDDGPSPIYTNQLLTLLERLQVKATFFVIGKNIEQYTDTVRLIITKGHELGNHSYSHQQLVLKKPSFIREEIEKTEQILHQLGVNQEIHFRAPFGFKLFILPYILSNMGKKNIMWDVDPKDYASSDPDLIENYIIEHIKPGSIILLHDGGSDRSATVAATERIIPKLRNKGYKFKTISELLLLDDS
ncbi:MAG TPA: polysaccharide deacetylase [Cyanothece sp. UBA12306]|nr:polysaccharide deacetylase [Cyanothece sp. UBA12306]